MSWQRAIRVSLAPQWPVPLAGRGGEERIGLQIDGPLEANIILFSSGSDGSIALIALDALFGSAELKAAIETALANQGIAHCDILLVASHTHNAPALDPAKPGLGRCDMEHLKQVAELIAAGIAQSHNGTEKHGCRLSRAHISCTANAVRRRRALRLGLQWPFFSYGTLLLPNRAVVTPHELDILLANDDEGRPQWLIWTWPCHATAYFDNLGISGDFPAKVRDSLREKLGVADLPIVYLPGFCGDIRSDATQRPVHWKRRLSTPFARGFADSTIETYASLCQQVSVRAVAAVEQRRDAGLLNIPAIVRRSHVAFADIMASPIEGKIGFASLTCGPLCLFLMGAETCSPYYSLIRSHFPAGSLLSGYCDAVPLYLPSDRQIDEGGYEVDGFRGSFGLPGKFHPRIEDHIVNAAIKTSPLRGN